MKFSYQFTQKPQFSTRVALFLGSGWSALPAISTKTSDEGAGIDRAKGVSAGAYLSGRTLLYVAEGRGYEEGRCIAGLRLYSAPMRRGLAVEVRGQAAFPWHRINRRRAV